MRPIQTFRDRKLSLWQSAAEEVIARPPAAAPGPLSALTAARTHGIDMEAVRNNPLALAATQLVASASAGSPAVAPSSVAGAAPVTAGIGSTTLTCSKLALQLAWAKIHNDTHAIEQLQNALSFSSCDPRWAETVELYVLYFKKDQGSIPYRSGGDYVLDFDLPAQASIALIGDWGTGTPAAQSLLAELAQHQPDVVFHLGDIYYSGTLLEAQARFLDISRNTLPPQTRVYSLSGNHDMYSGGAGYYWLVDRLGQQASYFCVRNSDWQFLAMDTGFNDFNPFTIASHVTSLTDVEAAWHVDKIRQAGARKTVLLSHHQLFTAFDAIGGGAVNQSLLDTFHGMLSDIAIWFWGHEHRLEIFAPYQGLQRGRCLGCSAIPVFVENDYFAPKFPEVPLLANASTGGQPVRLGDDGTLYKHAYAIMKLDGKNAVVEYHQEGNGGQPLFQETIA